MDKRIFTCNECKHIWEVEFGIPRPSKCPKCGSSKVHREDRVNHRFHRQRRIQRRRNYGRDQI